MNFQETEKIDIFINKIKYFNFQNNNFYEIENAFKSYINKEDYSINGIIFKYQENQNLEDYIILFLKEKIHYYLLTIEKYNKYLNKKLKETNSYGERVNSRNYGKHVYEITIKGFNFNLKKIKISEINYEKGENEKINIPKIIEDGGNSYYIKNLYSFEDSMYIKDTLNNILIYNQKINFCFFFIKTLQENKNLFLNIKNVQDVENFFDKIKNGK